MLTLFQIGFYAIIFTIKFAIIWEKYYGRIYDLIK